MSLGYEIIKDSVNRIMAALKEEKFSKEEMELLEKIFTEAALVTRKALDRGPVKHD